MSVPLIAGAIQQKTRELCETILNEPWFATVQRRIESFMQDERARAQYLEVSDKGRALEEKQSRGLPITGDEIAQFEKLRDDLFGNPVAQGFLEAQEEVHEIQETVVKHVAMTFELGRIPAAEELSGHAGHAGGCGCGH
jgi:cell fate (sporulation/competence/biofilm development) regulator YlbF (YheA/YmcA/DUF963 family)